MSLSPTIITLHSPKNTISPKKSPVIISSKLKKQAALLSSDTKTAVILQSNGSAKSKSKNKGPKLNGSANNSKSSDQLSDDDAERKNRRGDRLDNLVDSLSHVFCTDNETRSHKLPKKFNNMIVTQQVRRFFTTPTLSKYSNNHFIRLNDNVRPQAVQAAPTTHPDHGQPLH